MRVLFISNDTVGRAMAGPAIRAVELSRALAAEHDVTLATPNVPDVLPAGLRVTPLSRPSTLPWLVRRADVIILQGPRLMPILWSLVFNRATVVDLYDPYTIETLESSRSLPPSARRARQRRSEEVLAIHLRAADFFLSASERQRDFWLGALAGADRLDPLQYDADPTLRSLIDVVPFGLPMIPPRSGEGAIKGVLPGVAPTDLVLLWGGGIWDWLDPFTPIQALAAVRQRRPDVKLVFLGTRHPNPEIGRPQVVDRAVALAQHLGLAGTSVIFNEGWVPYEERDRYLIDADLAVSAHYDHLETRFAFRTRLLDCLWARLPIICTAGDDLGDSVARLGLGRTVPPQDVAAMTAAILELTGDEAAYRHCQTQLAEMAIRYTWQRSAAPLSGYCLKPRRTPRPTLARVQLITRILRFYGALVASKRGSSGSAGSK